MTDPRVVDAGELGADELLATLRREERGVVHTAFSGSEHEVTLRWDGETFYCDTPTRLHRHDDEAEMRACLENRGAPGSNGTFVVGRPGASAETG